MSESKDFKPQLPDGQITGVTRENSIQLGMKLATPAVSQLPQSKNKRKNSHLDEEKPVIAPTKSTSNQLHEIGEKREGSRETREIRIEERRENQREIRIEERRESQKEIRIEERRDSQREIRIGERRDSQREIRDLRNKLDDNTRDNSSRNYRNYSSREQVSYTSILKFSSVSFNGLQYYQISIPHHYYFLNFFKITSTLSLVMMFEFLPPYYSNNLIF